MSGSMFLLGYIHKFYPEEHVCYCDGCGLYLGGEDGDGV